MILAHGDSSTYGQVQTYISVIPVPRTGRHLKSQPHTHVYTYNPSTGEAKKDQSLALADKSAQPILQASGPSEKTCFKKYGG